MKVIFIFTRNKIHFFLTITHLKKMLIFFLKVTTHLPSMYKAKFAFLTKHIKTGGILLLWWSCWWDEWNFCEMNVSVHVLEKKIYTLTVLYITFSFIQMAFTIHGHWQKFQNNLTFECEIDARLDVFYRKIIFTYFSLSWLPVSRENTPIISSVSPLSVYSNI